MLFPWARAELFARDHACRIIAPAWTHFTRVGPWVRQEKDKRYYFQCFRSDGYVRGLHRAWLLTACRRVPETEAIIPRHDTSVVVEFHGMGAMFADFAEEATWLRTRLLDILNPRIAADLPCLWPSDRPFIAIHVRRGDFADWKPGTSLTNVRLPLEWYRAAIDFARKHVGDLQIQLFTDGTADEVASLTALPGVVIARAAPAIAHLLAISHAACIVTSASSFSMWAAYLSRAPAIWFPGVSACPRLPGAANLTMGFGVA
jgi:hypothetical protein